MLTALKAARPMTIIKHDPLSGRPKALDYTSCIDIASGGVKHASPVYEGFVLNVNLALPGRPVRDKGT
jgi:hypothetical protein